MDVATQGRETSFHVLNVCFSSFSPVGFKGNRCSYWTYFLLFVFFQGEKANGGQPSKNSPSGKGKQPWKGGERLDGGAQQIGGGRVVVCGSPIRSPRPVKVRSGRQGVYKGTPGYTIPNGVSWWVKGKSKCVASLWPRDFQWGCLRAFA